MALPLYPEHAIERDKWILSQRPERNTLDPQRPYAFFVEEERSAAGEIVPIATVFLTNRECPWHCAMCDLWRNTLTETVPVGAIPNQIDYALSKLTPARQIKLYNSGSFFDRKAIPTEDYPAIASRVHTFERTIVESHPALIGNDCLRFRDMLQNQLEVAMGLETAHPQTLELLNKRITLDQFSRSSAFLRKNNIDLRVFILVQPPFLPASDALYWAQRSVDFAFDCGATALTLIPTRGGNGAMETLAQQNRFSPPSLEILEAAVEYGISLQRGRVFADLWDARNHLHACTCFADRNARLQQMNLTQQIIPRFSCKACGGHS